MTIEDLENEEVVAWREFRLSRMGFDPQRAFDVARTTLELNAIEQLLTRGCPPETAVAILA